MAPTAPHGRARVSRSCRDLAGAPGFEPGITGPKPVALPLGHAPRPERQETEKRPPAQARRRRGPPRRERPTPRSREAAPPPGSAPGNSFHSRPSSSRPPAFGWGPPHCLKKKATPCSPHWSRISRTQSGCIGRARGPLSPPTITQSMHPRSSVPMRPINGSIDRKRAPAGGILQMAYPGESGTVLDGDSEPDMTGTPAAAISRGKEIPHQRASFRQNLEDVPVGPFHRVADGLDELPRYPLMEQVRHRVDEDHPRFAPTQRLVQPLGSQSQVETGFERMPGHARKRSENRSA